MKRKPLYIGSGHRGEGGDGVCGESNVKFQCRYKTLYAPSVG